MIPEQVIIAPILTEKTNQERERGVYVFRVDPRANKIEIKRVVKALYRVTAVGCRTINMRGKPKRRGRMVGRTSAWKKAIVTLADGEKIAMFEGA